MSLLDREELKLLAQHGTEPCLSLFMPTVRAGAETQQNPIRFKNLLRRAEAELGDRDGDPAILEPLRALAGDFDYWQHQSEGLAIFLAPDLDRRYRVPRTLDELVVVGDRFHTAPLLPLLTDDGRFHVLALSQNRVRLLEASHYSARELEVPEMPESLSDALGYDWEETSLQFHGGTGTPQQVAAKGRVHEGGPIHGGRRGATMFHGHGALDVQKEEVAKFLHLVDNAVTRLLTRREEPLVLAGVEWEAALYRSLSKHPRLVDGAIEGNPEGWSDQELREKAWEIVEPHFRRDLEAALDRYRELAGTDRTSAELEEVVPSAVDSRVDTLFVAEGARRWGRFDPSSREIELTDEGSDTEDLVDRAALETLLHGGAVFAVDPARLPDGGEVAAIYRF